MSEVSVNEVPAGEAKFKVSPTLQRYPVRKKELLQAWDTADDLILARVSTFDLAGKRVLIVNDSFGAISTALSSALAGHADITAYTDSFVSAKATEANSAGTVKPISQLSELSGTYDLVLMRIPKLMAFFEDILAHLSGHLKPESQVICGYMVKHQANSSFDLLKKYIGETTTSLAQKKARLIFAKFERKEVASPYPQKAKLDGFDKPFLNHSNLFSQGKLDIGTRFFLDHLPHGTVSSALDLGCANGVVGISVKQRRPSTRLIFTDDSMMAVLSAKANFATYFPGQEAEFHWTNCYENGPENSVELVLCNPPFHQGTTTVDHIAYQMFTDALRVLIPAGRLRMIGNTHLAYATALRRTFGASEGVTANHKFTILDAVKAG